MNIRNYFRAAFVASKIKSKTLPKKITVTLFQNLRYLDLCSCLLLSNPAIPTDVNQRLAFCRVLFAIMPHLQDKDTFMVCCSLSSKLFIKLKDEQRAIEVFCENFNNIKFIIGACLSSDDNVGISALHLLTTLIQFQVCFII